MNEMIGKIRETVNALFRELDSKSMDRDYYAYAYVCGSKELNGKNMLVSVANDAGSAVSYWKLSVANKRGGFSGLARVEFDDRRGGDPVEHVCSAFETKLSRLYGAK